MQSDICIISQYTDKNYVETKVNSVDFNAIDRSESMARKK